MEGKTLHAICILREDNNSGVSGLVKFSQASGGKLRIQAEVKGFSEGLHGFHVHEFGITNSDVNFCIGNLTQGCVSAGPHFNPHGKTHGGPADEIRHVGDFGNL